MNSPLARPPWQFLLPPRMLSSAQRQGSCSTMAFFLT